MQSSSGPQPPHSNGLQQKPQAVASLSHPPPGNHVPNGSYPRAQPFCLDANGCQKLTAPAASAFGLAGSEAPLSTQRASKGALREDSGGSGKRSHGFRELLALRSHGELSSYAIGGFGGRRTRGRVGQQQQQQELELEIEVGNGQHKGKGRRWAMDGEGQEEKHQEAGRKRMKRAVEGKAAEQQQQQAGCAEGKGLGCLKATANGKVLEVVRLEDIHEGNIIRQLQRIHNCLNVKLSPGEKVRGVTWYWVGWE